MGREKSEQGCSKRGVSPVPFLRHRRLDPGSHCPPPSGSTYRGPHSLGEEAGAEVTGVGTEAETGGPG